MDVFIHEEYVNKRKELKKKQKQQQQQQQLWVQTDLLSDTPIAMSVRSPATPQDNAASPSTGGQGAEGRRASPSFDRLLNYFKSN